MQTMYGFVSILALVCLVRIDSFSPAVEDDGEEAEIHQPDWVVEIPGGHHKARQVASQLGFTFVRSTSLPDHYHFRHEQKHQEGYKSKMDDHTGILLSHENVRSAEQQKVLKRQKRETMQALRQVYPHQWKNKDAWRQSEADASHLLNDALWPKQWYLHDTRLHRNGPKIDLHVIPVWRQNITGRGVAVTILDDGIERNHPDLKANYDPLSSWDLNGNDSDPTPDYTLGKANEHGTRCAGEVAMVANNGICGAGIAFNSKIGGVRILDGVVNSILEAESLLVGLNHTDIYSASWGPLDNGKTMEIPAQIVQKALLRGITEGRNKKGNIYIWASGNGGMQNDDCACDGFASSIYSISISSAAKDQTAPAYTERCPSTLATTFSSAANWEQPMIVTTDWKGKCTTIHSGTSAAAPLAAGVYALVLEANPNLTWRDIQHLTTWTSEWASLKADPKWKQNSAGFRVNTAFGFGLLNAAAIVDFAKKWKTVPVQINCQIKHDITPERLTKGKLTITIHSDGCKGTPSEINYLEHLQVIMSIKAPKRGGIAVSLTSPGNMETMLLNKRVLDISNQTIVKYPFNTVHNWGEPLRGQWKINVVGSSDSVVSYVRLDAYGTKSMPHHMAVAKGNRRTYNDNYNQAKNEYIPSWMCWKTSWIVVNIGIFLFAVAVVWLCFMYFRLNGRYKKVLLTSSHSITEQDANNL